MTFDIYKLCSLRGEPHASEESGQEQVSFPSGPRRVNVCWHPLGIVPALAFPPPKAAAQKAIPWPLGLPFFK